MSISAVVRDLDTTASGVQSADEEARPTALQIALLVPLVAALLGVVNGFRMTRLPDPEPSSAAETLLAG